MNRLNDLDLNHNVFLKNNCALNQLQDLDTTNQPELMALNCRENSLVWLDLSQNKN